MENIYEAFFYIIKDKFFKDFNDPNLKGNKDENRPHYYCFKSDNLLWMIPLSSRYEKYKALHDREMKKFNRCDKYFFVKIKGDKESVLLIQDIFPITDKYIERKYYVNKVPFQLKNSKTKSEINKKAKKIIALTRRGIKINPTQPNILEIEKQLLAKNISK